tara:strand:+ start:31407 stop:31910 length:504 start_codon:yes stop_codon:yes gene_type:complete
VKLKTYLQPVFQLLILLVLLVTYHLIFNNGEKNKNTVYIDNVLLFSGFNMTNDIKSTYENELKKQKSIVDSLLIDLQQSEEGTIKEDLQLRFVSENNKLKEMNDYFMNDLSGQVWERLNSYIQEFGELNDYSIILGTQGAGNLMYAKDDMNITKELLEFVNKKYEGE